jgi:hypothetical protein
MDMGSTSPGGSFGKPNDGVVNGTSVEEGPMEPATTINWRAHNNYTSKDDSNNNRSPVKTLLHPGIARMVTMASKGSMLTLRLGGYVAETMLDSARVSTLTSLGVSRRVIENILSKADEDTPGNNRWATSGMQVVNNAAGFIQFMISVGFHLVHSTVATVMYLAQDVVHIVDAVFGSTETSRAIASIISLIRAELGAGVSIYELFTALGFFSILQAKSWRRTLENIQMEVKWDVVVLDSGETRSHLFPAHRHHHTREDESIVRRIPRGSNYRIKVEDVSTKTVSVEITGGSCDTKFLVPPGATIINEETSSIVADTNDSKVFNYKITYKDTSTSVRERHGTIAPSSIIEEADVESEDSPIDNSERSGQQKKLIRSDSSGSSQITRKASITFLNIRGGVNNESDDLSFPAGLITSRMAKYVRFASASYGQSFMTLLGIGLSTLNFPKDEEHHSEHYAFAHHAQLEIDDILLSSYSDPPASNSRSIPLLHFITVDHEAKGIVLTIRGTLGLEDILADLTCEYENFEWQHRTWKAHRGMLQCAQMLTGSSSSILKTLKGALEKHPEYGLIFCGHSLGGGVAGLFGILVSVRINSGEFVTNDATGLPPGRPIHVFCYGPPATISSALRMETKGLITSVVYGLDIVPCLSLGLLRDFQSMAKSIKNDRHGVLEQIRRRVFSQMSSIPNSEDSDDYMYSILQNLRSHMNNEKLVPPGEVYHISTSTVFESHGSRTKKATRVIGTKIADVEKRFSEPVFGRKIFHHSPVYYERALRILAQGITDTRLTK